MPEQRARTYHRGRVVNTFAEEITAMLEGELSDPRIAPCHVTEVVLAPGGKSCRVFIAVVGTEQEELSTLEGLMAARGLYPHRDSSTHERAPRARDHVCNRSLGEDQFTHGRAAGAHGKTSQ